jgi:hypothetical protein
MLLVMCFEVAKHVLNLLTFLNEKDLNICTLLVLEVLVFPRTVSYIGRHGVFWYIYIYICVCMHL